MTTPSPDRESGLRRIGAGAWSLLGTFFLFLAVGWVLLQFWVIVPPVVMALVIVYVLNPVVSILQRRGLARWMGSCLSYLVLIGVFTLLGFLVIPSLVDQGAELADDFPRIYDELVADLENLGSDIGLEVDIPSYDEFRADIEENQGEFFSDQWGRITDVTLSVLEGVVLFLLAPVVAFYVLLDLPTLHRKTVELIPPKHRAEVAHVGRALSKAVGGFLRGQVLVALIVGVMTAFGFWLVDLPFWLLIGMIAGFLNIIPFVGPWVGGALGVIVALTTRDVETAIWAGLVALIVQQIDNHFISPTVLRATVRIHPALIVLGLVGGAAIGGFWGVVLAVPIMAIAKIIAGHFWRTRVLGQSWEEASEAIIPEYEAGDTLIERLRRTGEQRAIKAEETDLDLLAPLADDGEPGPES